MRRARLVSAFGALALAVAILPGGVAAAASKKTTTTVSSRTPAFAPPAATGQIALVSGNTLEVRSPESGQTTVDITSKTKITATVKVPLKDVVKGSCITASGTKAKDGALDATTVMLSAATGNCLGRVGAPTATRVFRGTGSRNFRPPTSGSGTSRRFKVPANEATASGKVTSVSASAIAIDGTMFSFSAVRSSSNKKARTTALKTKKISVKVSSKTLFERTGPAKASALKVGECATAFGSTNNIGTVSATRLTVTPATSSGCTAGIGGFAFVGPGGPGGAAA